MENDELIELLIQSGVVTRQQVNEFENSKQNFILAKKRASAEISERLVGPPSNQLMTEEQAACYERIMARVEQVSSAAEIPALLLQCYEEEKI